MLNPRLQRHGTPHHIAVSQKGSQIRVALQLSSPPPVPVEQDPAATVGLFFVRSVAQVVESGLDARNGLTHHSNAYGVGAKVSGRNVAVDEHEHAQMNLTKL